MLGRSHALCGLTFGASVAAALPAAPLPVRLLVIPVAGGAALLPDIDKPGSRVARSLGPITWLIAVVTAWTAARVYLATRTSLDSPNTNGGHRRLTHTIPGCVLFGAFAGVAVFLSPVAGAAVLALLIGLLSQGFRALGFGFCAAGAFLAWSVVTEFPAWWWLWPVLVAAGAWVHCLGDTVTNSGTPMLWPLVRNGKRWDKVRSPSYFSTGSDYEKGPVTRRLWVLFALSVGFATGLVQMVAVAVYAAWVTA
jgi:membrane-bound metal-dependent hydrolase YbcI (DUF457 family)